MHYDFFKHEGNTGFYFARNTPEMLSLWRRFFKLCDEDNLSTDDQTLFWKAVKSSNRQEFYNLQKCSDQPPRPGPLVTCYPDPCQTCAGGVADPNEYHNIINTLKKIDMPMVALHANFITGHEKKMEALRSVSLWLATESTPRMCNGSCLHFENPFN